MAGVGIFELLVLVIIICILVIPFWIIAIIDILKADLRGTVRLSGSLSSPFCPFLASCFIGSLERNRRSNKKIVSVSSRHDALVLFGPFESKLFL
ncbi:MAG: hypothetical protein C0392_15530 [Syntrophus sp. (in: bacteria)]|nr:hypothetical protein [Syntrophus sp. (in: bacteria)]